MIHDVGGRSKQNVAQFMRNGKPEKIRKAPAAKTRSLLNGVRQHDSIAISPRGKSPGVWAPVRRFAAAARAQILNWRAGGFCAASSAVLSRLLSKRLAAQVT